MQKMGTKDGIEVILRRFGDEQSTLLDQFERLSFEVQLNQAILGRSLSEPSVSRSNHPPPPPLRKTKAPPPPSPHPMASQVQQGQRRGLGFKNVLKRLLKPILRRRGGGKKEVPDPKDPRSWKRFSRSMRV